MSPSICTASAGARPASTLSFESHTIRIVTINGEPWFVASDICRAIGIGCVFHGKATADSRANRTQFPRQSER
ncbi:hypothetical protein LGM46_33480 [Burkholderia arboris]|nr:BRO family protein [Burkholderia arboris]MCA8037885.1 hypothetical protein [Burkholderia arboris]